MGDRQESWLNKNIPGWKNSETSTLREQHRAEGVVDPEAGDDYARQITQNLPGTSERAATAKADSDQPGFDRQKRVGHAQRQDRRDYQAGARIGRSLQR